MKTLVLVDVQNDFLPGGALAVPDGDQIVPIINALMPLFDLVVASKDWHPPGHASFAETHHKEVGEKIQLGDVEQLLWPVHCVENTLGADFPTNLHAEHIDHIVYKGTDLMIDSYSAFFDNARKRSTGLEDFLRKKGAKNLYFTGLATDYCVKYTALDALDLGFQTVVIPDACRGINLHENDEIEALEEIVKQGGTLVSSKDLF